MTGSVLATRFFGVGDVDWGLLNVEFAVEYLTIVGWRRQAVLLIDEQVREVEARGLPGWGVSTWAGGGSQRGVNYWLVGELRKLRDVVVGAFPVLRWRRSGVLMYTVKDGRLYVPVFKDENSRRRSEWRSHFILPTPSSELTPGGKNPTYVSALVGLVEERGGDKLLGRWHGLGCVARYGGSCMMSDRWLTVHPVGGERIGVSEYIQEHCYEFLGSSMGDFPVGGDIGAVLMEGVRLVNQVEDLELLSPVGGVLQETVKRVVVKAFENLYYGRHGVPSSFMVGAEGATATGAGTIRW